MRLTYPGSSDSRSLHKGGSCLTASASLSRVKKLYVQTSRLNLNQDSFTRFGGKLWNAIPNEFLQLSKGAFKKHFHDFLPSIMEAEDEYVEVPILLLRMANSASSTQCSNNG